MCGGCGTENRPGAAFCKNCGESLEKEVVREFPDGKGMPHRVLFLGIHSTRVIGDKVSGFDEVFARIGGMGVEVEYEVAKGKGPFTPVEAAYLKGFDAVFALGCHNDRFDPGKILQEGEVSVLLEFVAGGGGLLVTPCIYGSGFNYLEVKEGLTDLCSALGVGFPVDSGDLIDPAKRVRSRDDHYPGKKDDWALIEAGNHPLVGGLGKVSFGPHGGAFLKLGEGGDPLNSIEIVLETGKGQEPPSVPIMTLSSYGEGKAVVFGSPTAFMYPELLSSDLVDNAKLLERIVEMLLG